MGAFAQTLPAASGRAAWFWQLLRNELAPYRGRTALVARMVLASTLAMIICMTFKVPWGAYAALFALNISRENLHATARAARALVVGASLGALYLVVSIMLVVGNEMLRFFWVGFTLFLAFYAISAFNSYAESARFAYLCVIIIPVVDSHARGDAKIEATLWAVCAISIGSVTSLVVEVISAAFRRMDDLTVALTDRLLCVEGLLNSIAEHGSAPHAEWSAVARFASVGTSRLRRLVQRAAYSPQQEQHMGGTVALVGRLVDIVASVSQLTRVVSAADRERIRSLTQSIAEIRLALIRQNAPPFTSLAAAAVPSSVPLLGEIERTVKLLQDVLTGAQTPPISILAPENVRRPGVLVAGAFSDPEHVKFALRGCLAATLSYITWSALFWPGIATSVVTCLLTALTTVGASHQKQLLRFTGALIGGLVIGMGAQVFILPGIDSIAGFTVLFAAVAALASWVATASSRLSYLGVQIAVAFYLINLQEFKFQTSLAVARDRVVGIFVGLAAMWVAFDLLWTSPAAVEMRKSFVSTLRSLAQLAREPLSPDIRTAVESAYALREKIDAQLDKVRSLADGVLFEFGPTRRRDLAWRYRLREWQPQLRTLFLMRVTSLKYRLQLTGFELPEQLLQALREYDQDSARILEQIADWVECDQPPAEPLAKTSPPLSGPQPQSFETLIRGIDDLTNSLAKTIAAELPVL
jgi:multidrug resistance protein MdtO